jgi:hypothetical protein
MRVWICCLLSGGLLFAQAAGIARACTSPDATPAMAFADNMEGMDCEGMGSKNLCLQQCNAGDQNTHPAQVSVALPPDFPVLTLPAPVEPVTVAALSRCNILHSPDPPSSVRFCSFQI